MPVKWRLVKGNVVDEHGLPPDISNKADTGDGDELITGKFANGDVHEIPGMTVAKFNGS